MGFPFIGTVSHGTLRDADLLSTFAGVLDDCVDRAINLNEIDGRTAREYYALAIEARRLSADIEARDDASGLCDESAETIQALDDALNELAPSHLYFGAHIGDGSDFGFWPDWDSIDESANEGSVLKCDSAPDLVAVISDHGNVTLYSVELVELWGVV